MKTVNLEEAQATLPALVDAARAGEEVVLTDAAGAPVARVMAVAGEAGDEPRFNRVPGDLRSRPGWENFEYDPELFRAQTDEELIADGWDPDVIR
jgi:antitoxin (DNA-binding transcriptional repressor) of toxin-antitoxin stability system